MSSAQDIVGGYETARVSAADADARQQRRVAARSYLDRQHPQEIADELAAILGLDETTERAPGYCGCGRELPWGSTTATSTHGVRPGMCSRCSAVMKPAPPPIATTGQCQGCGRTYGLTGSGQVRAHPGWRGAARLRSWCEGSRLEPAVSTGSFDKPPNLRRVRAR